MTAYSEDEIAEAVNVLVTAIGRRADSENIRLAVETLQASIASDPVMGDFATVVCAEGPNGLDAETSEIVADLRGQFLDWSRSSVREGSARFTFCVVVVGTDELSVRALVRELADADALSDLPVIFREMVLSHVDGRQADIAQYQTAEIVRAGVVAITAAAEELDENPSFSLSLAELRSLERMRQHEPSWLPRPTRKWIGIGHDGAEQGNDSDRRAVGGRHAANDDAAVPKQKPSAGRHDRLASSALVVREEDNPPEQMNNRPSLDRSAKALEQMDRDEIQETGGESEQQRHASVWSSRFGRSIRNRLLAPFQNGRGEQSDNFVGMLDGVASRSRAVSLAYIVLVSESMRPSRADRVSRRSIALDLARALQAGEDADCNAWFVRYLIAGSSLRSVKPLPVSGELRLRDFPDYWGTQFDIHDGGSDIAWEIERDRASFNRRNVEVGEVILIMLAGQRPSAASDAVRGLEQLAAAATTVWVSFNDRSRKSGHIQLGGVDVVDAHEDVVNEVVSGLPGWASSAAEGDECANGGRKGAGY